MCHITLFGCWLYSSHLRGCVVGAAVACASVMWHMGSRHPVHILRGDTLLYDCHCWLMSICSCPLQVPLLHCRWLRNVLSTVPISKDTKDYLYATSEYWLQYISIDCNARYYTLGITHCSNIYHKLTVFRSWMRFRHIPQRYYQLSSTLATGAMATCRTYKKMSRSGLTSTAVRLRALCKCDQLLTEFATKFYASILHECDHIVVSPRTRPNVLVSFTFHWMMSRRLTSTPAFSRLALS